MKARALWIALAPLAGALAWAGCKSDGPPASTKCLGSIMPAEISVAAGASAPFTVSIGNPDDDTGGANTVAWMASGGGHFDPQETVLTQVPKTDMFDYPAGTEGSTTNAFHADGPVGTYGVEVTVLPGAGCAAATFTAVVHVTPAAADGGAPPADGGADAITDS